MRFASAQVRKLKDKPRSGASLRFQRRRNRVKRAGDHERSFVQIAVMVKAGTSAPASGAWPPRAFGRAARPVSFASGLGFLGGWLFRRQSPRFRALDFLGFPWILSSEMSLFNGLRWIFEINFFMARFGPRGGAAGPADRRFPTLEERNRSWAKPSYISVFPQSIVIASDQGRAPALMLRSEAVARRETGVLPSARWPRVSKHAPEARRRSCALERPSRRAFGAPRDEGVKYPKLSASRTISRRSR